MAFVIGMVIVLVVLSAAYRRVGITGLILAMIGGGVGFAVGSVAGFGWDIYGAVLGTLIGLAGKLAGKPGTK